MTLCIGLGAAAWLPAMASDWVKLGVDEDGGTRFVDKSSITRDGPVARAWNKVEFARPERDSSSGKLMSAVSYLLVTDCSGSFTGLEKGRKYDENGVLIAEKTLTVYTVPRRLRDGPYLKEAIQVMCAAGAANVPQ